ncbi:MAG: dihydrofolate reductase family protein, partial [Patescibacteria group bacterium]|nr:dihydrofolate reductase family protein [Patescibacteria group bacterium]
RRMTNLLFEGGAGVFGTLLDQRAIDEVHAFIAPKVVGGAEASSPVAGQGIAGMADAMVIPSPAIQVLGRDVYVSGRLARA